MSAEDALRRVEELLGRLDETRADLERVRGEEDAEGAIDLLTRLAELAREVEQELERAKRAVDAGA